MLCRPDELPELVLQWGRSSSERMTGEFEETTLTDGKASMGPLFFRADDEREQRTSAAAFVASMGPLFFRADDQVAAQALVTEMEALQWGRSSSERMTSHATHNASRSSYLLQWGRSSSERMTVLFQRWVAHDRGELQWGRSSSERMTCAGEGN